ncbi:MAG: hypothetical protein LUE89_08910, partial [Clostridiales bacterium]|nr:hypothetical protein [Clostridiales bacterium]
HGFHFILLLAQQNSCGGLLQPFLLFISKEMFLTIENSLRGPKTAEGVVFHVCFRTVTAP